MIYGTTNLIKNATKRCSELAMHWASLHWVYRSAMHWACRSVEVSNFIDARWTKKNSELSEANHEYNKKNKQ